MPANKEGEQVLSAGVWDHWAAFCWTLWHSPTLWRFIVKRFKAAQAWICSNWWVTEMYSSYIRMEHQMHWYEHKWPAILPGSLPFFVIDIQRQLSLSTAELFLGELCNIIILFKRESLTYNGKEHFVHSAFCKNKTLMLYCHTICTYGHKVSI